MKWLKSTKKDQGKPRRMKHSKHVRHNTALVVKRPWIDLILSGKKEWEIRNQPTKIRGFVKLAQSGTGKLVGQARIANCFKVKRSHFDKCVNKHRVRNLKQVLGYRNIYAWVIKDALRYDQPQRYNHPPGAIIWVKL